jgi:hypothetical protein
MLHRPQTVLSGHGDSTFGQQIHKTSPYNFIKIHRTLRVSPLQLAAIADPKVPSAKSKPFLTFADSGRIALGLSSEGIFLYNGPKNGLDLRATADGPSLTLADSQGYSAVIGSSKLITTRTGEQHRTSAASLALFGKDGKVLWSAP